MIKEIIVDVVALSSFQIEKRFIFILRWLQSSYPELMNDSVGPFQTARSQIPSVPVC